MNWVGESQIKNHISWTNILFLKFIPLLLFIIKPLLEKVEKNLSFNQMQNNIYQHFAH